jgi:hypothetical protein
MYPSHSSFADSTVLDETCMIMEGCKSGDRCLCVYAKSYWSILTRIFEVLSGLSLRVTMSCISRNDLDRCLSDSFSSKPNNKGRKTSFSIDIDHQIETTQRYERNIWTLRSINKRPDLKKGETTLKMFELESKDI